MSKDNLPNPEQLKILELEQYRDETDKFESLYTIVIYNLDVQSVIDILYKKLDMIKNIKNTFKRKYLNDRIYGIIQYFNEYKPDQNVNGIYLVNNHINHIKLSEDNLNVLKSYTVENFIFKYGSNFEIDYLNKLFFDISYNHVVQFNNNKMMHIHLNTTKRKIVNTIDSKDYNTDILPYLKEINNDVSRITVYHGVSSYLKNIKFETSYVFTKYLTDEEILKIYSDHDMGNKHKMLEEYIGYVTNEKMANRIVLGKDLDEAIKNYKIKTLFCIPMMYEKVHKLYSPEYLNFQIIEIRRLKQGRDQSDVFDVLKQNYRGILGYTYY